MRSTPARSTQMRLTLRRDARGRQRRVACPGGRPGQGRPGNHDPYGRARLACAKPKSRPPAIAARHRRDRWSSPNRRPADRKPAPVELAGEVEGRQRPGRDGLTRPCSRQRPEGPPPWALRRAGCSREAAKHSGTKDQRNCATCARVHRDRCFEWKISRGSFQPPAGPLTPRLLAISWIWRTMPSWGSKVNIGASKIRN
jgi:hypothetical protein